MSHFSRVVHPNDAGSFLDCLSMHRSWATRTSSLVRSLSVASTLRGKVVAHLGNRVRRGLHADGTYGFVFNRI